MTELYTNFINGISGERGEMLVDGGKVVYRGIPKTEAKNPEPWNGGRQHIGTRNQTDEHRTIDMGGRKLIPGLVDCHCHVLDTGIVLQSLDLGGCTSREQALERIAKKHQGLEPGKWLKAYQYDHNHFADGKHLTRQEIDQAAPGRCVFIRHFSGHAAVVNSAVLKLAGIDASTPDEGGVRFDRDASGYPTGPVYELGIDLVQQHVPVMTLEDMVDAILRVSYSMASNGLTCASDMMTGHYDLENELKAYKIACDRGAKIRFRLYAKWDKVLGANAIDPSLLKEISDSFDPVRCRIAGLKLFLDGALSAQTAAIYGAFEGKEPEHGDWSGELVYEPKLLLEMLRKAEDAGYGVAMHSIGNYSTDCALNALAQCHDASQHRLEHVMMLSDEQIERIVKMNVPVSMQPEFLPHCVKDYGVSIGATRRNSLNRYRSAIDAGVKLGFSSDRPVVEGNPWKGIAYAVQRPEGFDPAENIAEKEAILAYTAGAAELNDDTGNYGRLAPGEWADFTLI